MSSGVFSSVCQHILYCDNITGSKSHEETSIKYMVALKLMAMFNECIQLKKCVCMHGRTKQAHEYT